MFSSFQISKMGREIIRYGQKKKLLNFHWKALLVWSFILALIAVSCTKDWDEHYAPDDPALNQTLWDYIEAEEDFSTFTNLMVLNGLDSLLKGNQQYTLFIPNNDAFSKVPDSIDIGEFIMSHLISPNIFNIRNLSGLKQLQTLAGKFALLEKVDEMYYFDEVEIIHSSPQFLNGRYYEVNQLPLAKPNFEEYFRVYLPGLYSYLKFQTYDSLDKSMSTPIGFDDNGNTVYDSVFITINPFENQYFPVSEETREDYATFILFTQEQYTSALDEMALQIGGAYQSYEDIPLVWQESVLLPVVLDNGVFADMLSIEELSSPTLININGEHVVLDVATIDPDSRVLCSNGIIYHFYDFSIDESLYSGENKREGESLIDSVGTDYYVWKESVIVQGEIVEPTKLKSDFASEGGYVVAGLGNSFAGTYSVEFTFQNIFPGRYRLEWGANYRPSGVYTVYINDEAIGEYDIFNLRSALYSVTGEIFSPNSAGFNKVDFWVENLTEYGDVRVKFEYKTKGVSKSNGFNIDYVSLIPSPL